jgi:PDZ domain-containing protein
VADGADVLLLVGMGPHSALPLAVRERADAAVVAARRARVPVVAATVAVNGGPVDQDTLALAGDGRVDDRTLAAIAGPGKTSIAVAGAPTHRILAGLAARLAEVGGRLVVLDDACVIDAGEQALPGPAGARPASAGAASVTTSAWTSSLQRGRPTRRRVISLVSLGVIIALLVAVVVWSNHEAAGYYTLSPGSAPLLTTSASCSARGGSLDLTLPGGQPCARIDVPADQSHATNGSLFMVDVLEGRSTWSDYLLHELGLLHTFRDGSQLLPASSILGSTPPDQLTCQNDQEMVQAQTDAPVAALQRLGYDVHEQDLGAQVYQVQPGYPAAMAGIACNDAITSIDGQPVRTVQDVSKLLTGRAPGTTVAMGLTSPGAKGAPTSRTVQVKLAPTPAIDGQPADPRQGFLGVEVMTRATYQLPFDVTVAVGDIGGPSAGLALTLGIMDVLSNGKLLGGHRVAATGTIAPDGTVGDVGGVAQKTVAVRHAGAQLFLVPPQELKVAQSEAGHAMKVVAVSNLEQALNALASIGGQVPKPPQS